MDFSTVDRALTSLSRRRPPLSNEILDLSAELLKILQSSGENNNNDAQSENVEYAHKILQLIELGTTTSSTTTNSNNTDKTTNQSTIIRWEPLAVGMRLIVDYLEKRTEELPPTTTTIDDEEEDEGTGLGTGGGGVYAEGPRIPKIAQSDDSINVIGDGNTLNNEAATTSTKHSSPPNANSPVFGLLMALPAIVNTHVEHAEPRVRSLVAQTVGAYALYATSLLNWVGSLDPKPTNNEMKKSLEESVQRVQIGRREIHTAILHSLKAHLEMKEPNRDENPSAASDGALDDTTGWRALETNLHALASYVDGCVGRAGTDGYMGGSYIAEEIGLFDSGDDGEENHSTWFLSGLQHCCVVHVNRHVRAASAAVLGVLVKACMRSRDSSHRDLLVDDSSLFRLVLKESLRSTLADNWSQVRMAGSVLCRRFVRALLKIHANNEEKHDDEEEEEQLTDFEAATDDLVPMLLPRMCLNRFYLAQGVKLYSQETWRLIFGAHGQTPDELHSSEETKGGGGMGAVARSAAPLCRFYTKMCDADNHAVREAACQGVAELAQKVGQHPMYAEYLSPYVATLLQVSLMWLSCHCSTLPLILMLLFHHDRLCSCAFMTSHGQLGMKHVLHAARSALPMLMSVYQNSPLSSKGGQNN